MNVCPKINRTHTVFIYILFCKRAEQRCSASFSSSTCNVIHAGVKKKTARTKTTSHKKHVRYFEVIINKTQGYLKKSWFKFHIGSSVVFHQHENTSLTVNAKNKKSRALRDSPVIRAVGSFCEGTCAVLSPAARLL